VRKGRPRKTRPGEAGAAKTRTAAHAGKAHAAAHRVHAAAKAAAMHAASKTAAVPATAVPAATTAASERGRRDGNGGAEHCGNQASQNLVLHPSLHLELRRCIPPREGAKESEIAKRIQMTKVTESVHVYEREVS